VSAARVSDAANAPRDVSRGTGGTNGYGYIFET
jgi:hypothetical protein